MAKYRVSTLLTQGKGGWSESFYVEAGTAQLALEQVKTPSALRRRLIGTDANIIGYRAQEVTASGNALIEEVLEPAVGGELRDIPQMTLGVQLGTTDGLKRLFLLRGLPDNIVSRGAYLNSSSTFNGNLNQWMAAIASGNFYVRRILRTNAPTPIASVSSTGLVTFFTAHALTNGMTIQFLRTRDTAGHLVTGKYRILDAPTLTTVQLAPWTAGRTVANGTVRKVVYDYFAINSAINTKKITTRKVGRPFGAPRGRRSSRR